MAGNIRTQSVKSIAAEQAEQGYNIRTASLIGSSFVGIGFDQAIDQFKILNDYLFSKLSQAFVTEAKPATLYKPVDVQVDAEKINGKVTDDFDINKILEAEAASTSPNDNSMRSAPIRGYIQYFTTGNGHQTLETGFTRAGKYRRIVEEIFEKEGVPKDLIWLGQVESVWKTEATSGVAAKGIWQFMSATGKRFGLRQDSWVDERLNVEKSTYAAAHYLHILRDRYNGDWLLAMAAYNYGEGAIDRATQNCGCNDFWTLRERGLLPTETSNYVPSILAVIAIAKQPENYGVHVQPEPELNYEMVNINRPAKLRELAESMNVPATTLSSLNPELISGKVPPDGYEIRVPKNVEPILTAKMDR